jgi:hypothetical protein
MGQYTQFISAQLIKFHTFMEFGEVTFLLHKSSYPETDMPNFSLRSLLILQLVGSCALYMNTDHGPELSCNSRLDLKQNTASTASLL